MAGKKHIEIEKIVRQQLESERRTVKWLCKEMNWQRPKWYRFQLDGLIEVHDLQRISVLLNHNFFQYYSLQFEHLTEKCIKIDTQV
ncbi:MAG: hypothetical protein LBL13_13285 [Bacteroidales bacterium]|jgi:hypothetical protein|nr:hypothetical protein [Bacteroidales bacterium]